MTPDWPGIDEPVCMIDVTGQSEVMYYYHFDGLGSVVALSNTDGEIVERYSYDVFGEPNPTSDVDNPYLFTGRRYDDEVGLYYYRYRYYSTNIGRFLQTDPVGYLDSMNRYAYVMNNPSNRIDPLGLLGLGIGGSASGGAAGGGTIGFQLVVDQKGDVGIFIHTGGGGYAGAGGGFAVDASGFSGTIQDLEGWFCSTGGSGRIGLAGPTLGGEFSFSESGASIAVSGGIGGGVPLELHSFVEYGGVFEISDVISPQIVRDYWTDVAENTWSGWSGCWHNFGYQWGEGVRDWERRSADFRRRWEQSRAEFNKGNKNKK